MNWVEVSPIPRECETCQELDCYNCDHLGKRWVLPERRQLLLRRKLMEQAIARYQREIAKIDRRLERMK